MRTFELVLAGILALLGVRSAARWLGTRFDAASVGEQLLYSIHVTARVGIWFALAGAFIGYALLDEPEDFTWYVLIPIALAGSQLLTGIVLARSPDGRGLDDGDGPGAE